MLDQIPMPKYILIIIAFFQTAFGADWATFNEEARKQIPEIFKSDKVQITSFAIIGKISVQNKDYDIISCHGVLTGMLAPRGQAYLLIYNPDLKIVSNYHWHGDVYPLWCEGSKLYLYGMSATPGIKADPKLEEYGDLGNVIDFSNGIDAPILSREKRYGSSGGIDDDPWVLAKPK